MNRTMDRRLGTRARLLTLATLLAVGATPLHGQVADSVPSRRQPLFVAGDAWYAGGFVLGVIAMAPIDLKIANQLRDSTTQTNKFLRDSATGFRLLGNPGAVLLTTGMYVAGRVVHRPELAQVGLHGAESVGMAIVATNALKSLAGRARPDQDPDHPGNLKLGRGFANHKYSSFPSGHTTAAFAAAASLSTEIAELYPKSEVWVRPILYGGATLVGASRMYNNKHWASDVVAGAAIGSFSGWKVTRYNHTHPNNRLNRIFLGSHPRPNLNGGMSFSWTF
jgi:membrane-associated phospholipid phosphatase